jgi:adenosine deaminase
MDIHEFAYRLPKAELHLHIEGTLEPELMFALAERNGVDLPYADVDAVRSAYEFSDLQSFLDIYYAGAAVLRTREDFVELASAYLDRARAQGVRHVELFFDPQTHTGRGIDIGTVIDGLSAALDDARRHGMSGALIMCFLRHLSGEAAEKTLAEALPYVDRLLGVGLDSSELGHPAEKFAAVYATAREHGLIPVAHAGEEGDPSYVWAALDILGVRRVDHGVRSLEDPALVARLRDERIPLTVCPLSNVALRVVDSLADHMLPAMLEAGLLVSINSDDPAYFGGYVGDNYAAAAVELGLDRDTLAEIARNSFRSAFIDENRRSQLIAEVDEFVARM